MYFACFLASASQTASSEVSSPVRAAVSTQQTAGFPQNKLMKPGCGGGGADAFEEEALKSDEGAFGEFEPVSAGEGKAPFVRHSLLEWRCSHPAEGLWRWRSPGI